MSQSRYPAFAIAAVLSITLNSGASIPGQGTAKEYSYRFDGGQWYQDGSFQSETVYVEKDRLVFERPGLAADQVIDITGGYVVPPYCEGHNHNFGGAAEGARETSQAYLKEGIFYAMMFGSFRFYRDQIEAQINKPDAVDVVFANNGLTGSGGHPRGLREALKERFGFYPEFSRETLADAGYFEADTFEEMRSKWALIRAEKTDFVKAMLYFSEEYEQRRDDPRFFGRRGLNPELLDEFVALAKSDGVRTAVHVESEADLRTAIAAGAEIIAHLPSYDSNIVLSDVTIELIKVSGVALITTFSLSKRVERQNPQQFQDILEAQRTNLARLSAAGAWLVVGSDNSRGTATSELEHLHSLNVLSNRELLEMWTSQCSRLAFPDRAIGKLAEGYEASFLVLEGNPLEDISNTSKIRFRMKDGQELVPDD